MMGGRNLLILLVWSAFFLGGCRNASVSSAPTSSPAAAPVPAGTSSGTPSPTVGAATLRWSAPTTRLDNTPVSLSEIAGYRLYYGPTATDTPSFVNINDGTASQYTINLPAGSYYFRISAIDTQGFEGEKSVALQKTVN